MLIRPMTKLYDFFHFYKNTLCHSTFKANFKPEQNARSFQSFLFFKNTICWVQGGSNLPTQLHDKICFSLHNKTYRHQKICVIQSLLPPRVDQRMRFKNQARVMRDFF